MRRTMLVPAFVLMLGTVAIATTLFLDSHAAAARSAARQLATLKTSLISLQAVPLAANPGTGGDAVSAARSMRQGKLQISGIVARLEERSPTDSFRKLPRALRVNYASLDRLFVLGASAARPNSRAPSPPPRNAEPVRLLAASTASFGAALRLVDDSRAIYDGRAALADRESRIGSISVVVLLLAAFLLLYRQNYRQHRRLLGISRREALSDPLTGLANRRALTRDLEAALPAATSQRPLVLALFDLDGFKRYNDTFGHPAGDALLARLGDRLIAATAGMARTAGAAGTTGTANAYRIGGDEFCLLAVVDPARRDELLQTCAAALSESGETFNVTCSHGVATAPAEASTAEEALRLADQRLYQDKAGRRSGNREIIDVLRTVMDERSAGLEQHLTTVARTARLTARQLRLPSEELDRIQLAAILHDVGKTAIPNSLLYKPGPLEPDEWQFTHTHTLIGERIILAAPSLAHVAGLVRSSHERPDGTGYPDGLSGDDIPLGSSIIAVCDAFDAMTCDRPYSVARTPIEALTELRLASGTQFDPRVVEAFCQLAADHPAQLERTAAIETQAA
jgi:diguanylate cyclase (GGDEF)-like protein